MKVMRGNIDNTCGTNPRLPEYLASVPWNRKLRIFPIQGGISEDHRKCNVSCNPMTTKVEN